MLQKQGMSNCSPLKLPATVNEKNVKSNDNHEVADATSYWNLIGSLLFLAKQTRPDIFLVKVFYLVSWINVQKLMQGAKRVLRYLHGTLELKIVHRKQEDPVLLAESDADEWRSK